MHRVANNVNEAFVEMIELFVNKEVSVRVPNAGITESDSRQGPILTLEQPLTMTYLNPKQRVLFNAARDCNPFFHCIEAIWMFAGSNKVTPLSFFNSGIAELASDDGKTFNGAYGHRWRVHFVGDGETHRQYTDQLPTIVEELKTTPTSRRVVLQMWNITDLYKINNQYGEYSKDVPCNTHAYFRIRDNGKTKCLDMTVCNRSNDLVWGMMGANIVHFSMLQEYIAKAVGVEVGYYHQITNNLHVYTQRWKPQEYLQAHSAKTEDTYFYDQCGELPPLCIDPHRFLKECVQVIKLLEEEVHRYTTGQQTWMTNWNVFEERFIKYTVVPMIESYFSHREKNRVAALSYASDIESPDWRKACIDWLTRRYEKKGQEPASSQS